MATITPLSDKTAQRPARRYPSVPLVAAHLRSLGITPERVLSCGPWMEGYGEALAAELAAPR
jgi:hypothetical protein